MKRIFTKIFFAVTFLAILGGSSFTSMQAFAAETTPTKQTAPISQEWQLLTDKKSGITLAVPPTYKKNAATGDYLFLTMDPCSSLQAGVMVVDTKKTKDFGGYAFPQYLDVVTMEKDRAEINAVLTNRIKELTYGNVMDIENRWTDVNGVPCIKSSFTEENGKTKSHSISYIYIKDYKMISFDYMYDLSEDATARLVVETSILKSHQGK
jgi:hypothetical protein